MYFFFRASYSLFGANVNSVSAW